MNKKMILIASLLLVLSFSAFAGNQGSPYSAGSFKAGVALGYPTGVTAGWKVTDKFELNALLGTNYLGFTVGVTPLFTVANLNIDGQPLPFSVGPQVNFSIGALGYGAIIDILAAFRLEYTLKDIPLNLFIEGGLGVSIRTYESILGYTFPSTVGFGGSGVIGARYVF